MFILFGCVVYLCIPVADLPSNLNIKLKCGLWFDLRKNNSWFEDVIWDLICDLALWFDLWFAHHWQLLLYAVQEAVAISFDTERQRLDSPECYHNSISIELGPKRDKMAKFLQEVGMVPTVPEGGYFMVADFSSLSTLSRNPHFAVIELRKVQK